MLIGRARELTELAAIVDEGRNGPSTLIVVGAAGVGKTALLAAVRGQATGSTILAVSCGETDADDVHGMLRRLIEPVRDDLGGSSALRSFLDGHATDPMMLRSAILAVLDQLAAQRPVLLIVDDIQNADRDSVHLLMLVLRGLAHQQVAVVLAARDFVPPVVAAGELAVYHLFPLAEAAAAELLDRQPNAPQGWARGEILRQSAGNPLALIELSRVVDAGPAAFGHSDLPPSDWLRKAFAAQLVGLPDETRRLLLYAAAAWGQDDLWAIMSAATISDSAAGTPDSAAGAADDLRGWEPAEEAGLVTIVDDQVQFRHPLLRTACYYESSEAERELAHRHLAAQTDDPYRRSWHLAAATPGPSEPIAAALEESAELAAQRGGSFEAAKALQRSAERSPDDDDAARRYAKAVFAAYRAGDPSWAVDLHAQVDALTSSPDVRGAAACGAALALSHSARGSEAFDLARRAVEGRPRDGQVAMTGAAVAATAALFSGDETQRAALPGLLARVDDVHSGPLGEAMIPRQANAAARASVVAIADPAGFARELDGRGVSSLMPPTTGLAEVARLLFVGTVAWLVDDSAVTIALLRAVLARQREAGSLGSVAGRSLLLITALIDTGHWDEAMDVLDETECFAAVGNMTLLLAAVPALRATVLALRGDSQGAQAALRADRTDIDPAQNAFVHCLRLRAAGRAALADWDHASAYRLFRAMFDADGRPLHYLVAPRSVSELAWCAAHSDQQADAARVLAAAQPPATARVKALHQHAQALLASGDEAEEHFRAALAEPMNAQHWPLEFAEAQLSYGEWLRRRRRPAEGNPLLTEAVESFERIGARGHVAQARKHLRNGAAEDSTFELLTAQQQHIVRLAAQGLTNQQIGERLSISGRTVGSHLYRIYPVLKVANRSKLRDVLPDAGGVLR
jgi:hypothetical protein